VSTEMTTAAVDEHEHLKQTADRDMPWDEETA
jgi:hypothetical protein